MAKMHVAVLRGGPSEEFDVSLRSGARVLESIDRDRYDFRDVVITKSGEWLLHGRVREPHEILHGVDVALNALHGAYGEDGTLSRLLERLGIPYTGSGSYASLIAFNKAMAKDHLRDADIALPRHFVVTRDTVGKSVDMARTLSHLFGPRFIVKPLRGGSSIGVLRADNEHVLALALSRTLAQYDQIIVEEFIEGREVTCGVIESFRGSDLYVLPAIEIVPKEPYFTYEAKYSGETTEICPSSFDRRIKAEIERIAREAHTRLGLAQYSRTDMIVGNDGHVYYLETNTLPGLTAESLFPKALHAVGARYIDFIDHLLTDARGRKRSAVR